MPKTRLAIYAVIALTAGLLGCAKKTAQGPAEIGEISYYADTLAGNKTASGEIYDPKASSCAHPKLPFGTELRIELIGSNKKAACTVNDRGPYAKDRILDVSRAVAERLGIIKKGVAQAKLTIVSRPQKKK